MWHQVPDTWMKTIDSGFFSTWPELTYQLVRKHIEKDRNIETDKGNLRSTRKNILPTKVKESDPDTCEKSKEFYVKTIDLKGKS